MRLESKQPTVQPPFRQKAAGKPIAGFTLVEVVISVAIVAVVFGGIIASYIQSGLRLQWAGYSLAAQSLANQTVEQAKSAVWDPAQTPQVNQLYQMKLLGIVSNSTSWSGYSTNILDVPYSSTNYVLATNYVTLKTLTVSNYTGVLIQLMRVDTVWPFYIRRQNLFFTNTICAVIAPDNRDASTF
jgi:prepilin-type N-terminal cleavage/methylation domain-containing protein